MLVLALSPPVRMPVPASGNHEVAARRPSPPFADWFPDAPFDATYGYDLEALLQVPVPPPPEGFADFWRGRYTRARGVHVAPELGAPVRHGDHLVRPLRFTSLDEYRLGGWLALPADGTPRSGVVVSHGYGGRAAPDLAAVPADAAAIFPVARGLPEPSLLAEIPSPEQGHVLHGIESVETYVLGGCAADVWCAATVLTEVCGQLPLVFSGTSFGGGQGALALPWDDRFVAAALRVPSFGQYDVRLASPCTGSGELVRHHVAAHPEARDVLRFFDAATAATSLRVPALLGCALWDPAVPPPGQFAVYNACADVAELQVLDAGHAEYPTQADDDEEWLRRVRAMAVRA